MLFFLVDVVDNQYSALSTKLANTWDSAPNRAQTRKSSPSIRNDALEESIADAKAALAVSTAFFTELVWDDSVRAVLSGAIRRISVSRESARKDISRKREAISAVSGVLASERDSEEIPDATRAISCTPTATASPKPAASTRPLRSSSRRDIKSGSDRKVPATAAARSAE